MATSEYSRRRVIVDSFRAIEVKVNPQSPYGYANMYHGAF
jgi:hypothetical protein